MTEFLPSLMHIPQLLITWVMFFGAGILIYSIYALKTDQKFAFGELWEHCVPFNPLMEKSFYADVKIYIIGKLTDGIILAPSLAAGAFFCASTSQMLKSTFPGHYPAEFDIFFASICTVIMFVFAEFSDFFAHYVSHKVPFLWEFHKVHHSAQSLNPLTSKRGHPIDVAITSILRSTITAFPAGAFVFLFDLSIAEAVTLSLVGSKIFVIATLDPLKHSHYPISLGAFDKFLISPHMHQIHHSKVPAHWDKNFGTNLSVFDWLFGVAYKPAKEEAAVYGISGLSDATLEKYHTMHGAYVAPIKKSYKKFKKMFLMSALEQKLNQKNY